jgi:5-methylcytosine-specific restriction endonuclease McrA
MDKQLIETTLEEHITLRPTANALGISYSTLRYWLGKHNISATPRSQSNKKYCCKSCGDTHHDNFYGRRKTLCKNCFNIQSIQGWIALKKRAIEYKGGECTHCGYDRYYGTLEFHHLDPLEKEHTWTTLRLHPWGAVKQELDKCVLLCSNCHREEHGRLRGDF